MRPAVRNGLLGIGLAAVLVAGGGAAVAGGTPALSAAGPVTVDGTEADGAFTIADRTIRQVRYDDRGTLRYTFSLINHDRLPVTVTGLAGTQANPRLFDLVDLTEVRLRPGARREVTLSLDMNGCETLSSRSGSFVRTVRVRTEQAGVFHDVVTVALPEEIHTGSPREASCPGATATSRPQG